MSDIIIRQITSTVIENQEVGAGVYCLTLSPIEFPQPVAPGQFVMIRATEGMDPLLRRAFSIHELSDHKMKILYKVVGRGTNWLARRRRGDSIDIVGPLGSGFVIPETLRKAWIVAGGIGVAPFQFLIPMLLAKGVETKLFFGAKTSGELIELDCIANPGLSMVLATDDGTRGEAGRITEVFMDQIAGERADKSLAVYACGPQIMLSIIARICDRSKISCQVSLESDMACGLGTCAGCVISTRHGYQRVCREGPVFMADEVIWK